MNTTIKISFGKSVVIFGEGSIQQPSGGENGDLLVKVGDETGISTWSSPENAGIAKKNDIVQLEAEIKGNMFVIPGYINKTTGYITSDELSQCTDYLMLDLNTDLDITGMDGGNNRNYSICYFYDNNKKPLAYYATGLAFGFRNVVIPKSEFPEGAVYFRSSTFINNLADSNVKGYTTQGVQRNMENEIQKVYGNNIFSIAGYVNKNTGSVNISTETVCTDFLSLDKNSDLFIRGLDGGNNRTYGICVFYDINRNYIDFYATGLAFGFRNVVIPMSAFPEGAVYFRSSTYIDRLSDSYISGYSLSAISQTVIALDNNIKRNTFNVGRYTGTTFDSKERARNSVPAIYRANNLEIKYRLDDGSVLDECFIGADAGAGWTLDTNWRSSLSSVIEVEYEYIYAISDNDGRILFGIDKNGKIVGDFKNVFTASSSSIIKNNLVNQSELNDIFLSVNNYGSINAEYLISASFIGRISAKFKVLKTLFDGTVGKIPFATFENSLGLVENTLSTIHVMPVQAFDQYREYAATQIPHARLSGGFDVAGNQRIYDRLNRSVSSGNGSKNDIIGDKMIMLWYKGADVTAYPDKSVLIARANEIGNIQDLYIDISNDTLKVGRDGIAVDGSSFNGGAESTLFSTSLKSSGNWKSINTLYEELKTSTALANFYIYFVDMSKELTCEDVLQCGKIKLIGYYAQQVSGGGTGVNDPDFGYYYDAYPFFIYDKIERQREHYIDFILKGSTVEVYIDGDLINTLSKTDNIRLGNILSDCRFYDLEIYKDTYGDAELTNNRIISERTPIALGMMLHNFIDTYEDSGEALPNGGHSITRMYAIMQHLIDKGYKLYPIRDIADWRKGRKYIRKRSAFIVSDDRTFWDGWLNNHRIRASYERMGGVVNFATILTSSDDLTPENVSSAKFAGHDLCSHTRFHDVFLPNKNSLFFYYELKDSMGIMNSKCISQNAIVYNGSGYFVVTEDMLDYFGIAIAINSTGVRSDYYNSVSTNNYMLGRMSVADSSTPELPEFI